MVLFQWVDLGKYPIECCPSYKIILYKIFLYIIFNLRHTSILVNILLVAVTGLGVLPYTNGQIPISNCLMISLLGKPFLVKGLRDGGNPVLSDLMVPKLYVPSRNRFSIRSMLVKKLSKYMW